LLAASAAQPKAASIKSIVQLNGASFELHAVLCHSASEAQLKQLSPKHEQAFTRPTGFDLKQIEVINTGKK